MKSIKNILIITTLFLLMLGVVGTASATIPPNYDNATAFLNNITNLQNNSVITINSSQANVSQNYTINASNITIKAINGQVTFQSNKTQIHFIINGNNVTLQGIKFQNFNGTLDGGAILWNGDNGTITNCNFTNNIANNGGAIYLQNNKTKWNMNNCTFKENNANNYGGAISVFDAVNYWNMTNCNFCENNANKYGGAISVNSTDTLNMTNCNFCENNANKGSGAILVNIVQSWNMNNCNFCENNATNGDGGAIYVFSTVNYWNMTNCRFRENNANLYGGGAIFVFSTVNYWNMTNCNFCENNANLYGEGGAIYVYDAVNYWNMNNCTFRENNANLYGGGAIYVFSTDTWNMNNCNFCENNANKGDGGAIYVFSTDTWNMNNCTFRENNANYGGGISVDSTVQSWNMNNCNFCENNANYGGAISVNSTDTWNMTDCNFSDNYAMGMKQDIYNSGEITLKGNTKAIIYNAGTINNKINLIILDNQTKEVPTNSRIVLTAQLLVGNYTIIGLGFQFIIQNQKIPGVISNGQYTSGYQTNNTLEEVLVNGSYMFSNNITYYTALLLVKNSVEITSGLITIPYSKKNNTIILNLTSNGANVNNGTVTVTIQGINGTYTGEVKDGKANITLPHLNTDVYILKATYTGNNYYMDANSTIILYVTTPAGYNLTAGNVYKEFENATQYHAILTDSNGNPIANKTISIAISSAKWSKDALYWIVTDKDGIATLDINLSPNEYVITAIFGEEIAINNITVIASNFKLQADNLVKYFKNGTQYTVKVTDKNNNPVANRTVTISIYKSTWKNPVKYYAKTNADGIATLDINLIAGSYSVTSSICYNSTKSSITVLPTLTAESITKKVNKAGSLKAKLVDGQGTPSIGKEVTFTVGYKTYTYTTDINGIATLPIHLNVGTWNVLVACHDTGASTRATVKVIK